MDTKLDLYHIHRYFSLNFPKVVLFLRFRAADRFYQAAGLLARKHGKWYILRLNFY